MRRLGGPVPPASCGAMPRCLMAKKWKAYPWPERPPAPVGEGGPQDAADDDDEEIDVVGDSATAATCWGPSSPTAGATAPSPPPTSPHGTTLLYNGKSLLLYFYISI